MGTAAWVGTPCRPPVGGIDGRVWLGNEPEVVVPGWAGAAVEGVADSAATLAVANAGMRPPMVNATTRTTVSRTRSWPPRNLNFGEDECPIDGLHRPCRRTTDAPTDRFDQISAIARGSTRMQYRFGPRASRGMKLTQDLLVVQGGKFRSGRVLRGWSRTRPHPGNQPVTAGGGVALDVVVVDRGPGCSPAAMSTLAHGRR